MNHERMKKVFEEKEVEPTTRRVERGEVLTTGLQDSE